MCLAERVRDPLCCRASGLTPELPVRVVLVLPLLVPPPLSAVVTKKLWILHGPATALSSRRFFSRFLHSTGRIQVRTFIRWTHNKTHFNSSRHNGYHVASWVHDIEEYKGGHYILALFFGIVRVLDHSLWFLRMQTN